jgi:hypothetical protein
MEESTTEQTIGWSLLVIGAPGMHLSLTAIFAIPLFFSWQTRRPGQHLTPETWKALTGWAKPHKVHLLQCKVGHRNVLHAQGDTAFLKQLPLRMLTRDDGGGRHGDKAPERHHRIEIELMKCTSLFL